MQPLKTGDSPVTHSTHYFYKELLAVAQLAVANDLDIGLSVVELSYLLLLAPPVAEA
jgi:hypothetical protein